MVPNEEWGEEQRNAEIIMAARWMTVGIFIAILGLLLPFSGDGEGLKSPGRLLTAASFLLLGAVLCRWGFRRLRKVGRR